MANLAGRTTSGESAWDKYVTKNKNWKNLVLEAENECDFYKKVGSDMKSQAKLSKGDSFKLETHIVSLFKNKRYASVKIGNKKGFIELKDIRKPTNFKPTGYEAEVVSAINKVIRENKGMPIDIKLKGGTKIYKGISGAIQVDTDLKRAAGVKADPKTDIILYVKKTELLSQNNIFVSHKKEGGPEAFQQYGGLTEAAGSQIYNHPEVKKFLRQVTKYIDGDKLTKPLYKEIKSTDLKNMSIFGPDYGTKFGIEHVTLIGQGLPKLTLTKKENVYELEFSSHMSLSGDLSHFTEGYTPVFGATYREGRGFSIDGERYTGARVGIYPKKLIETRTGAEKLK